MRYPYKGTGGATPERSRKRLFCVQDSVHRLGVIFTILDAFKAGE